MFSDSTEKQLVYDDVKSQRIEEEYTKYYRQRISDEVDATLKKNYRVKILENVLSKAIASK